MKAEAGHCFRHRKRDSNYSVVGTATVQAETPIAEGQTVVVYRSLDDGSLWVRAENEFLDGRFERIWP